MIFFNPSFREAYFKDVHYELEKQGVDFWWIDWQQGTQGMLDPLWLLNHYHYQDSCKNAEGGLIYQDMQVLVVTATLLVFRRYHY